jgi:cellulose synthase/poly-beta-1,6-N-acetylglucosamine synthase-like glycosyltransferase
MTWLLCLSIVLCGITIFANLLLLILHRKDRIKEAEAIELPKISILVAARNEAERIENCLDSLLALRYPSSKLEIWVGNDGSEDETEEILKRYAKAFPRIKYLNITHTIGQAKGKSNVLAQLAKSAGGEAFLITDADMQHHPDWAAEMVVAMQDGYDLVTGMTIVKGNALFARFQRYDWLLALGMVQTLSRLGLPVTAMGNNMLITKKAYEATGGYENLPFSITEDFQLFKEVIRKGGKTINLTNERYCGLTEPAPSWMELLHQRKRWMRGAVTLPPAIFLLMTVQAIFFPAVILLFWWQPLWGLPTLLAKIFSQSLFIQKIAKESRADYSIGTLIIYEAYSALLSLSLLAFYALPIKINWKGRNY